MRSPRSDRRRETPNKQDLEERLFRFWQNGVGIGSTILAIQYSYGLTLPFETVRQAFVNCCDRFAGGSFD